MQRGEDHEGEEVLSMHAQYGCGRSSAWQMPWLVMYILMATASVLDVALALEAGPSEYKTPGAFPHRWGAGHPQG